MPAARGSPAGPNLRTRGAHRTSGCRLRQSGRGRTAAAAQHASAAGMAEGAQQGMTQSTAPTALQIGGARTSGSVGRLHKGARAEAKVSGQLCQEPLANTRTNQARCGDFQQEGSGSSKPCCSNSVQPLAHLQNSASHLAPVVRARMPAYVVPLTVLPRMCCTKRTSLDTTAGKED